MAGRVFIGTSGWAYKSWGEIFYPAGLRPARQLAYYATRFPTVEINASFYRLPGLDAFSAWRDAVPPGFLFAVKGSRTVTHFFKLLPGARSFRLLHGRLHRLGPHLGPILWQLPAGFGRDVPRLAAFLDRLPVRFRHAIELRDPSWRTHQVHELLRLHGVAVVSTSTLALPPDLSVTAGFAYLRFHGLAGGAAHDYTRAELQPWADHLRACAARGLDAFAYFNNDINVRAPANAELLMDLVGDAAVLPSAADDAAADAWAAQADRRRRRGRGGRPGGRHRGARPPAVPRAR